MSGRASAARYAHALLDVAVLESDPVRAGEDLATFAVLVDGHPDLRGALTNPAVPAQTKHRVTQELIARLQPVSPVSKLLLMLADRDRFVLLQDVAAVYRERLMEHQKILRAEVITAVPLAAGRAEQLRQRLSQATGFTVTMTTTVDQALIGGVVARIGSTVYDGSVATQLAKMRQRLLQGS
ncbi:MAG: ATP synthase F1 subunit delta [Vicinamibacterales bacterium]